MDFDIMVSMFNKQLCMEKEKRINCTLHAQERAREAVKITWTGFYVNLILSLGKILTGIFGRSAAMLADGIHSLSDFLTDLIVIIFIKISSKAKDEDHHYGHGKFETLATLLVSVMLIIVGVGILYKGIKDIIASINGTVLEAPSYWAIIAAVASIAVKEWLYRITVIIGKKIGSEAVIANAWHHRSDAFSSIGTLIGISGAFFLGSKWRILDPLASIVVSFFIVKVGYDLLKPALQELLERALPKDIEERIGEIISLTPGVIKFHNLKTRKSGNTYIIDVHIKVDPAITVVEAHDISTEVEKGLRENYGDTTQTSIHIEPYFSKENAEAAASVSANDIQ
jgi:cation diffusion facilitator family transporter